MKIITKESKSTYYAPDKFCCKKMKKAFNLSLKLDQESSKIYFYSYDGGNDTRYNYIDYCPFCGQKILDEVEWALK